MEMKYRFKGMSYGHDNKIIEGEKFGSYGDIEDYLERNLYEPVYIRPAYGYFLKEIVGYFIKPTLSNKDVVSFVGDYVRFNKVKPTLIERMKIIQETTQSIAVKNVAADIASRLEGGKNLSDVMAETGVFPPLIPKMVSVGEKTGDVDSMFENLVDYLRRQERNKKVVLDALFYPILVFTCLVAFIAFLAFYIAPGLATAKNIESASLIVRILMGVNKYAMVVAPGVALLIWGMWVAFKQFIAIYEEEFYRTLYGTPAVGYLCHTLILANIIRAIGILLYAHVPIVDAIDFTSESLANKYIKDIFVLIRDKIEKGATPSDTFKEEPFFPIFLPHFLHKGEVTGNLGGAMIEASDFMSEKLDEHIKTVTPYINPAALLIAGGILAFVMIGIFGEFYGYAGKF